MVASTEPRHQVYLTEEEEAEKQRLLKERAPEEKYEHELTIEEAKCLTDMELLDQRLCEHMEKQISKALGLLRGICMACAACYAFDVKHVKVMTTFRKAIFNEVTVFKGRLLPIAVLILKRISFCFEAWTEKKLNHFQHKIDQVAAVVHEHRKLLQCLEWWFANLASDMGSWEAHAKVVLDALYLDSRRIRIEEHELRVSSKVVGGWLNMFIPLLFVPGLNQRAEKFVHGGQERNFRMPQPCHNVEERAVAGTLAMKDTMVECCRQFSDLMKDIGGSLEAFKTSLEHLQALGEYKTEVDPEWEKEEAARRAEIEAKQRAKARGADSDDDGFSEEEQEESVFEPEPKAQSAPERRKSNQRRRSSLPKLEELQNLLEVVQTAPAEGQLASAAEPNSPKALGDFFDTKSLATVGWSPGIAEGCWMNVWLYYQKVECPPEEEKMCPPEVDGGPPRHRRLLSYPMFVASHHYTITNRCPRIQACCDDISNQFSLLLGDVEEVPFDREKYGPAWMDESAAPDGECIKDHVYDATKNVEVILTVD